VSPKVGFSAAATFLAAALTFFSSSSLNNAVCEATTCLNY
jgi:hypothetical protein